MSSRKRPGINSLTLETLMGAANNNQKLHKKLSESAAAEVQIPGPSSPQQNGEDHTLKGKKRRRRKGKVNGNAEAEITEQASPITKKQAPSPKVISRQESVQDEAPTPRWAKAVKKTKLQQKGPKAPKTVTFFSDDEDERDSRSLTQAQLKTKARELLEVRKTLPVFKSKDEILERLSKNRITVLIGETGSGKSTQIPQFLMELNSKSIAITQPRRVAAINLATRVSEEVGTRLGDKVGYSVRFDNKSSQHTKIKYLTDGMLLREIMTNGSLSQYSTVIIDEAHERTVLTDLLMGFLKELMAKRDDLKIIIMSATLDAEKFAKFYGDAEILFVEGRMYDVDRLYLDKPVDDIVDSTVKAVIQINNGEVAGDMLVFLPGQEEIDKCVNLLERLAPELPKEAPLLVPFPLYASLPPADQAKVFAPLKARRRKVILATNIAETSVTVPGVRYVIDSGLRKVKVWRHQLGLSTLLTAPVSMASATQRAGRAGREQEGKAFRLYTEADFAKLPIQTEPEILRSNVTSPVLMLKRAGVDDILNWPWLESPGQDSLVSASTQLYHLKALDDQGKITELGIQMAILPLEPQLSAILLTAHKTQCLSTAVDIVSCLSVDNLILNPASEVRDEVNERRRNICILGTKYGDLLMVKELLDFYLQFDNSQERKQWCIELALSHRAFKNVIRIRNQIRQYMVSLTKDTHLFDEVDETRSTPLDIESVLKAFLSGYVSNTAIGMPDRSYRTTTSGQLISVHPSSLMFGNRSDAIMYTDYVYTTKGYARNVTKIELAWLQEIGSHVLTPKESIA